VSCELAFVPLGHCKVGINCPSPSMLTMLVVASQAASADMRDDVYGVHDDDEMHCRYNCRLHVLSLSLKPAPRS